MAKNSSVDTAAGRPCLAVSSCLLGNEVRYDGGHKHDRYISGTLGRYFDLLPVCPEVAIGLGTPRPTLQLRRRPEGVRVLGVRNPDKDVTAALSAYARTMAGELQGICGYLFKKGSPSCGVWRVPVYPQGDGAPQRSGSGEYARVFRELQPNIPVEEEGRLNDPVLRENFLVRVFTLHRWQQLARQRIGAAELVDFHRRHKFLLLSHDQQAYRRLGRLVAGAGAGDIGNLASQYLDGLMQTLARNATRRAHTNVLQHLQGYLKRQIDSEDRQELAEVIDRYRLGRIPLVVPLTLLQHHFRRHPNRYVQDQVYLEPHPAELMLRNLL